MKGLQVKQHALSWQTGVEHATSIATKMIRIEQSKVESHTRNSLQAERCGPRRIVSLVTPRMKRNFLSSLTVQSKRWSVGLSSIYSHSHEIKRESGDVSLSKESRSSLLLVVLNQWNVAAGPIGLLYNVLRAYLRCKNSLLTYQGGKNRRNRRGGMWNERGVCIIRGVINRQVHWRRANFARINAH